MPILRDVLPREFFQSYMDTRAATMLDVEIAEDYSLRVSGGEFAHTRKRWPGAEKNVMNWWKLSDGRCVGWNENPSRGWSFPVFGRKSK